MDVATYIEQISEILKYIWEQVDWNFLNPYYHYIIIGAIILVFLFIVSKIVSRKRAVKEYLTDSVCLKIDSRTFTDKEQQIEEIVASIHDWLFELYNKKKYFTLEILSNAKGCFMFIILPRDVYKQHEKDLSSKYQVEIVTKAREKFIEKMSQEALSFDLELACDFVKPLNLPRKESIKLVDEELYLVQLLCRPLSEKWSNTIDKFIGRVKGGKIATNDRAGCLGGFVRITLPFFSFITDLITFIVHGSGKSKSDTKKNSGSLDQTSIKRIELAESKKDKHGFETALRILVKGTRKERSYYIADKLMDTFTFQSEDYNYYAIANVRKKLKTGLKNDYLLAYMDKSSVDVLNKREVRRLVNSLLTS